MKHRKLVSASVLGATVATLAFSVRTAEASTTGPAITCPSGYTAVGGLCVDKLAYCKGLVWWGIETNTWCPAAPIGRVPAGSVPHVPALPVAPQVHHVTTNKVATPVAAPVAHAVRLFWSY